MAHHEVLNTALERWKTSQEAEQQNRNDGLECDRFKAGEQWPRNVRSSREVQNRPCLTIPRLRQFVKQVTNDARMNRPSIKVAPVEDNDVETAKIIEGMCRHIQVASNADVAYDTACESQVSKGWGYFRVITEYCDNDTFDQDIRIKPIKNAFSVYFDPFCVEPDYSDARYCFVVEDMPREEFKKRYPKASEAGNVEYVSTGDNLPDWSNEKTVRVAEYFEVVDRAAILYLFPNGQTLLTADKEEAAKAIAMSGMAVANQRPSKIREVLWRKITATDILEGGEEGQLWPGKYIPIIPVLGEDMIVDGKRYLRGMVYDAMDSQRMLNYWTTAMTELIALAPKAPWVAANGQIENYQEIWQNANIETFSVLPYDPITVDGMAVPPPQRIQSEPPVQAMVQAIMLAAENMKATTGIFDAGLGAKSNETSGKAIVARQREGDVANFNYIDNLSRAIRHLGVILLDLIPKIYDAPRVVRILGEDMSTETVHINQPLDQSGKPLPGNSPQEAMAKMYDLTAKKYDVVVETGPSFTTKRQENAEAMLQLVQASPELMQQAGDLIVKNLDFAEAQTLAERLQKFLPPNVLDDKGEDVPPQVKAQLAQMGQMVEQLTGTVNALEDEKAAKTADLASREKIAAMNNETKLTLEAFKMESQANMNLLMAQIKDLQGQQAHAQARELQAEKPAAQPAR